MWVLIKKLLFYNNNQLSEDLNIPWYFCFSPFQYSLNDSCNAAYCFLIPESECSTYSYSTILSSICYLLGPIALPFSNQFYCHPAFLLSYTQFLFCRELWHCQGCVLAPKTVWIFSVTCTNTSIAVMTNWSAMFDYTGPLFGFQHTN